MSTINNGMGINTGVAAWSTNFGREYQGSKRDRYLVDISATDGPQFIIRMSAEPVHPGGADPVVTLVADDIAYIGTVVQAAITALKLKGM